MNTDTYQNALESTKDSIEDVNSAIGFSLGNLTLEKLITSAITLVICVLVIWLVMRVARRISAHSRLSESLSRFILKVLKIALEFMAILIVADSLGFNVTALLAVFSLLGLALSLSVQNCLSNAMSGITILLTRPFEDGDFVEAGDVSGTVKDIGLIYTQLCTLDNKDIYVPNSDLSASKIVNYSREPQRRVDLTFGADYTCRPEQVKAALHNAVSLVSGILPEPAPFVRVSGYGESNIEYTVRVWCKTADYWTVYYDLMEAVGAAFDAHGVSMSYPQMNVHVLDTPESAEGGATEMAKTTEKYELMYIINPNLSEEETAAVVEKFKALVEQNGTLEEMEEMGKRKLAYEINYISEGYYVLVKFTSGPDFPAELDRVLGITDGILRSLITRRPE